MLALFIPEKPWRFLMTLSKDRIIDNVFNNTGLNRSKSTELVETLLELMKQSLESGEDVLISGFGKFCVKEKSERKGRNPQTGQDLLLKPRKVVTFKCSLVLREKMNG